MPSASRGGGKPYGDGVVLYNVFLRGIVQFCEFSKFVATFSVWIIVLNSWYFTLKQHFKNCTIETIMSKIISLFFLLQGYYVIFITFLFPTMQRSPNEKRQTSHIYQCFPYGGDCPRMDSFGSNDAFVSVSASFGTWEGGGLLGCLNMFKHTPEIISTK